MPSPLTPIGTRRGRTNDGLDRFVRKHKTDVSCESLVLPSRYSADAVFSGMYLVDDDSGEAGNSATTVDLIYVGSLDGSLPGIKHQHGATIQSASYNDGEQQLEILYRAPHTVIKWIGTSDALLYSGVSTPESPIIIERRVDGHIPIVFRYEDAVKNSIGYAQATDAQRTRIDAYLSSGPVAAAIAAAKLRITNMFARAFTTSTLITNFDAEEIVPGHYWQCATTTAKTLIPV